VFLSGGRRSSFWEHVSLSLLIGFMIVSLERKARDGLSTDCWKDPWFGATPLTICFARLFQVSIQKKLK
jgi:hypothetical protein